MNAGRVLVLGAADQGWMETGSVAAHSAKSSTRSVQHNAPVVLHPVLSRRVSRHAVSPRVALPRPDMRAGHQALGTASRHTERGSPLSELSSQCLSLASKTQVLGVTNAATAALPEPFARFLRRFAGLPRTQTHCQEAAPSKRRRRRVAVHVTPSPSRQFKSWGVPKTSFYSL